MWVSLGCRGEFSLDGTPLPCGTWKDRDQQCALPGAPTSNHNSKAVIARPEMVRPERGEQRGQPGEQRWWESASKRRQQYCADYSGASASECDEVSRHLSAHCRWRDVSPNVHAIHFKGRLKPWVHPGCGSLRIGRLQVAERETSGGNASALVDPRARLEWYHRLGRCLSGGHAVSFANGKRVARRCCRFETLLQAEWYALLGNDLYE